MAEHVIVKLILWDSREAIVSVDPDAKRPQVKLKVAGTETWLDTTDVPAIVKAIELTAELIKRRGR
jgi:hypothetical protein